MKNRGIGFGIFLLTVGAIWMLFTFKVIDIYIFQSLIALSPLILVVMGVGIIFKDRPLISHLAWIAFLTAVVVHYSVTNNDLTGTEFTGDNNVKYEMRQGLEKGDIELLLGGLELNVNSGSDNLSSITSSGIDFKSNVEYNADGKGATIEVKNERTVLGISELRSNKRQMELDLNKDVIWDISLSVGAIKGIIDLRELNVEELDIKLGAGDFDIKLGELSKELYVDLSSGAASVDFTLPREAGVRIHSTNVLSSTSYGGMDLTKADNNTFVSKDFENAPVKIYIDASTAIGSLNFTQE